MSLQYYEVMKALSDCGIGVLLVTDENLILSVNEAGASMLHTDGVLKGMPLEQVAPFLCDNRQQPTYGNPAFDEYLTQCPSPQDVELPPKTRLVAFRNAVSEFHEKALHTVFQYLREAITVWDSKGRMLMINAAAEKLEAHLSGDVVGTPGYLLYHGKYKGNEDSLAIPRVLLDKKPILNMRQDCVTHSGKEMLFVSDNYPILHHDDIVGAISVMEDHSSVNDLHKRIGTLQKTLADQNEQRKPRQEDGLTAQYHFSDITFSGPAIGKVIERCRMIALSDSPVMIYGETGTGKELFAQSIHNASRRKQGPFIAINCAAIPNTLLESTLFGTEKGAYTGSTQREGLLELAHTGTLLLDEINSMDIMLQAKLLRFLQEGVIRRVGGLKSMRVDVRIISNTNVPPIEAIEKKQLRQDLYYRLGIANVTIPPLRERREDIPLLAKTFIHNGRHRIEKNITGLDDTVMDIFYAYQWPGNVRELQHAMEYAMTILPFDVASITPEYLPDHILDAVHFHQSPMHTTDPQENRLKAVSNDAVRRTIIQSLCEHDKNISKAAAALGVTRQNLQRYMKNLSVTLNDLDF